MTPSQDMITTLIRKENDQASRATGARLTLEHADEAGTAELVQLHNLHQAEIASLAIASTTRRKYTELRPKVGELVQTDGKWHAPRDSGYSATKHDTLTQWEA